MTKRLLAAALALAACAPPSTQGGGSAATGPFDLVVLSTTDVHGRIRAWDYYGDSAESSRGLARAATIVDSIRAANRGRVLLLDAGDLLQGNPFAYVAMKQFADSPNPIIAAMNTMAYDAAAIGNHEYNYGVPYLEKAVLDARFPMLSANTYTPDGRLKFKAWTIVERQGVKIGIVGATTPGVMVWDADNVRWKLSVTDIVPAVKKAVSEVKAAGAAVTIITIHSGLNEPASYDTVSTGLPAENVSERLAREISGIDLIVYGHSHREQANLHIGKTLLVQPKNWATSVGVARLSLTNEGGAWRVGSSRGELVQSRGRVEHTAVVASSDRVHRATVAYANTVIGTTPVAWRGDSARLHDTPLVDLITEVEMKAAKTDLASSAAFTLDAALPAGPITVARIAQLYPYDNTLRAVSISGAQLREYLEFSARYYTRLEAGKPVVDPSIPGYNFDIVSGADYTIDLTRPIGSRITALTFKGKAVAPTDSFTMALNNYRQTGGGGFAMLRGAPLVYDKQEEIRQLLIDEVRAKGTLLPQDYFKRNWTLVTGPGTLTLPSGPRLRIITTNDFHGSLVPRPDANGVLRGGAAFTASVIDKARTECRPECETILLDGGDMFQGTPASNLAYGRPVVEYYNKMGYTAAALGNHEFDWGVDTLRARMRAANFAILGANVQLSNGTDASWIRDDTIVVRGKTRVGIIGIGHLDTPTSTLAANVKGLKFVDPAPVIDERARSLRSRGADIVIVIAHEGGFCNSGGGSAGCSGDIFEIVPRITEKVDLVVSAHTHSLVNTQVNGIPVVQARWGGGAVGVADIPLDANGKRGGPVVAEVRSVVATEVAAYAPVDSIVSRAWARVAPLVTRTITTTRVPLNRDGSQYPLGNIIADSHRWAGKGDIGVMNNRGIRAGLRAGEVNYGNLFEIQPFANTLYRVKMTGAQVRQYFERILGGSEVPVHVSGLTIAYDPSKAEGSRVVSLRLSDGKTLDEDSEYNVVMNNFLSTGGSDLGPPPGTTSTPLNIVDLDATVDYLRTLKRPLAPPTEARIVISQ